MSVDKNALNVNGSVFANKFTVDHWPTLPAEAYQVCFPPLSVC